MSVIAIVGAGMMGSALSFPLRENGHEVRLVGTHLDREIISSGRKTGRHPKFDRDFPAGMKYFQIEELDEALAGAELMVSGVSSFGVDWLAENVLPRVRVPVLSVTKGLSLDEEGGLTDFPSGYAARFPGLCFNAVGGPCTSYELVAGDQTVVTFCGPDPEVLVWLKGLFATPSYHIRLSADVRGTEAAVALKNGYALGIALSVGLCRRQFKNETLHFNSQAALFEQGLKEMSALLRLMGAGEDCLFTGAGDLYVTVYGGRTRKLGILLGEGDTFAQAMAKLDGVTLESVVITGRVAKAVRKWAEKGICSLRDFPLLLHVDGILSEGRKADIPWEDFVRA